MAIVEPAVDASRDRQVRVSQENWAGSKAQSEECSGEPKLAQNPNWSTSSASPASKQGCVTTRSLIQCLHLEAEERQDARDRQGREQQHRKKRVGPTMVPAIHRHPSRKALQDGGHDHAGPLAFKEASGLAIGDEPAHVSLAGPHLCSTHPRRGALLEGRSESPLLGCGKSFQCGAEGKKDLEIGMLPVMLRSNLCALSGKSEEDACKQATLEAEKPRKWSL